MEERFIAWEARDGAGWVYFSRPGKLNALTQGALRELWGCLNALETDPAVRAVVFTGRGTAFCAGMDMAGLEKAAPMAARRLSRELQAVTGRIAELSLPTIAAVNGVAMGAGLEICLACDLALATPAARFAFAEARLGMLPYGGGTQRLARLVGLRHAREMVLAGRVVDAETAAEWGLVNEVVSEEGLAARVEEWVKKLSQGGKTALYLSKRCLNRSLDLDLERGLELETESFATCFGSGEPVRGIRRFAGGGEEPEGREGREGDETRREKTHSEGGVLSGGKAAEAEGAEEAEEAEEDELFE
ncbi:MAG: enoyl-CoA hydratase/isomerase family protein [Actinobacteria bacterium]|nr:enoyl-CoA hydratase/isomerase family protein [Actinomycetota bacterium]